MKEYIIKGSTKNYLSKGNVQMKYILSWILNCESDILTLSHLFINVYL